MHTPPYCPRTKVLGLPERTTEARLVQVKVTFTIAIRQYGANGMEGQHY